jgi:protein-tyrosine phosphatase
MRPLAIAFLVAFLGAAPQPGAKAADMNAVKIVFVDTGNTGRSLAAEALAERLIQKSNLDVLVISRAVDMDPFFVHPEPNVETLLRGRGIDVSGHIAAQITVNDVRHADIILTMTAGHEATLLSTFPDAKAKTFTLAKYATGRDADVPDAFGKPLAVYAAMLRQLDRYLPFALAHALKGGH